jgi:hypothetical protein
MLSPADSGVLRDALNEVAPVEFVGRAGDVLFLHPLMLHSAGINCATHGAGTLRVATVMEWQRARPEGVPRTLWWTLKDELRATRENLATDTNRLDNLYFNLMVQADGSFAPAMDGRDPASEAEDEVVS